LLDSTLSKHDAHLTKTMKRTPLKATSWPLWLALVACSTTPPLSARDAADASDTGQWIVPKTPTERYLLQRLPSMPTGAPERVGELSVTADATYTAASGRTCRPLELSTIRTHAISHRLACTKGAAWFFVPDVFANSAIAE
jgi:hypothetical protein